MNSYSTLVMKKNAMQLLDTVEQRIFNYTIVARMFASRPRVIAQRAVMDAVLIAN
jgi:hypothetical protein